MAAQSLQDLYMSKLQLIYDAEHQALEAYPLLLPQVQHQQLRQAMETHVQQTRDQVRKLEQLFASAGLRGGQRQQCASMRALIQETQQMLGQIQDPATRDAFLIGASQAVEHHEIASYGTARTWAQQLGRDQDARILEGILAEEKQADELLTQVAEGLVNRDAARGDREVARGAQSDRATSVGTPSSGSRPLGGEPRI